MLNYSANGPSGYNLTNSLRFRSSASAYLSRTATTPTNNLKWTWSGWVKRGALNTLQGIFDGYSSGTNWTTFFFNSDNTLYFYNVVSGIDWDFYTTAVFRDPSAWYHIVLAYDSTQATASDRVKIYVNNTLQSGSSPSGQTPQNQTTYINAATGQYLGRRTDGGYYYDGYITEVNFVDGQQLTPSSFGNTNSTTGVWQPAKYTGTYGTNGFYLNFSNIALTSGSNTGLGQDYSGNGNFWNTNNISVTSGTTYDAMTDVPTNTSATVANYAVMNPIWAGYGTPTFSNANLTTVTTTLQTAVSTMTFPNSSKTYLEATFTAGVAARIGIRLVTDVTQYGGWVALSSGAIRLADVDQQTGLATFTTNDVIGIAVDLSANTLQFYKNNVAFGTANTITNSSDWVTQTQCNSGSGLTNTIAWNFGQRPFTYTPPSGFVALNTFNLPSSAIPQGNKYMDATLYTGNGSTQTITNTAGFKPDLIWTKTRSISSGTSVVDSVRGLTLLSGTATTSAEVTQSAGVGFTAFNSNGFSLGTDATIGSTNFNGATYVGWQWQAGQGSSSSNTSGSITSTVSVNATAGFSVVTYTGTGANATVGHGLGVAPKFFTVKRRSAIGNWMTWHTSLTGSGPYVILNSTNGVATGAWNNTLPTSTVFSLLGSDTDENANGSTYVAYCWAEIAGFSKFGSYTGNGSTDGPFVYLGFRPKYVVIKRTDGAGAWYVLDSVRNTYNVMNLYNELQDTAAEGTFTFWDFLSNGFKLRQSASAINGSGQSFIYMAFAENPFKNALAR